MHRRHRQQYQQNAQWSESAAWTVDGACVLAPPLYRVQ